MGWRNTCWCRGFLVRFGQGSFWFVGYIVFKTVTAHWIYTCFVMCLLKHMTWRILLKKETLILVKNLNVFIDSDGISRVDGKTANSMKYQYDLVNPILIVKYHLLSRLIINDRHWWCKHLGIGMTDQVEIIWILGFQVRYSVKAVISECYTCKKNSSWRTHQKRINLAKSIPTYWTWLHRILLDT